MNHSDECALERRILVVDDSPATGYQLAQMLDRKDREIEICTSATEALEMLAETNYALVITDLDYADITGLDFVRETRQRGWPVSVLVLTHSASIDNAVEAMKLGAYDYLLMPVDETLLNMTVEQAMNDLSLKAEVEMRRSRFLIASTLIGGSPAMRVVHKQLSTAASCDLPVLILGEMGAGKELAVQALHAAGASRRSGPLITINCGAISEHLFESELFGHERGAFTGAVRRKIGRFEMAAGGTLFLDELGELPRNMQAKLLRVLQTGTFERVGGHSTLHADVRIVSATNGNLDAMVSAHEFRQDLLYRLKVITIELPPLRSRLLDIPVLADHFLALYREQGAADFQGFSPQAMSRMLAFDWPGNVRQLANLVRNLILFAKGPVIELSDIEEYIPMPESPDPDPGPAVNPITSPDQVRADVDVDPDQPGFEFGVGLEFGFGFGFGRKPHRERLDSSLTSTSATPSSSPLAPTLPKIDIQRPLQAVMDETTERIERSYLIQILRRYRGKIELCAQHCGLSRRSVSEKLRRYQIDKSEFKIADADSDAEPKTRTRAGVATKGEVASEHATKPYPT